MSFFMNWFSTFLYVFFVASVSAATTFFWQFLLRFWVAWKKDSFSYYKDDLIFIGKFFILSLLFCFLIPAFSYFSHIPMKL